MDIPNWKCSKKLQRKKTITTIQIHYSAKLQMKREEKKKTFRRGECANNRVVSYIQW